MPISIKAEMAGVIEEIVVEIGVTVTDEDEILILSSMKMEMPIIAGKGGVVAEILVDKGDVVKVGDVLFMIEP